MTTKPMFAIILDFEATCDDRKQPRPQEIIEFPSLIVSLDTLETIDEFRAFVKPCHHPILTDFCRTFTSTSQSDVDAGEPFNKVFNNHQMWLKNNRITVENSVFVTCGDWDLGTMLPSQCASAEPSVELIPPLYLRWHNLKKSFCTVQNKKKASGMAGMLRDLGLQLVGHHHCGIDDCRNIKELLKILVLKGAQIEFTTELPITKYPPISLKLRLGEQIEYVKLVNRTIKTLNRIASKTFKNRISEFHSQHGTQIKSNIDLALLTPGEEILLNP